MFRTSPTGRQNAGFCIRPQNQLPRGLRRSKRQAPWWTEQQNRRQVVTRVEVKQWHSGFLTGGGYAWRGGPIQGLDLGHCASKAAKNRPGVACSGQTASGRSGHRRTVAAGSGCDQRSADLFFHIVSRRHEQRSLVITTNLSFKEWGSIFPGAACVAALID